MTSPTSSPPAGRASAAVLVLAAAIAITGVAWLLWSPGAEAPDDSAPPTRTNSESGAAQLSGSAFEDTESAELQRSKVDDATDATIEGRSSTPDTIVRGAFRTPTGFWPGGGDATLHPLTRMPEGGLLGTMGEVMSQARKGNLDDIKDRDTQAKVDFVSMFEHTEAVFEAEISPHGTFEMVSPPVGEWELRLDHPRLRLTAAVPVTIAAGDRIDLGTIDSALASAITILCYDRQGDPVVGARVQVAKHMDFTRFGQASTLQDLPNMFRNMVPRKGVTDERGMYRLEGVESTHWSLVVQADGMLDEVRTLELTPGREELVRIEISGGAALRVTVTDPSGAPYHEARVRIRFPDEAPIASTGATIKTTRDGTSLRTEEDGSATRHGLVPGKAIVSIATAGYRRERKDIYLKNGETSEVSFQLDPGITVSGTVLDEDGQPVPDAHVMHMGVLGQELMGIDVSSFVGLDLLALGIEKRGIAAAEDGSFVVGGFDADDEVHLVAGARGFDPQRIDANPGDSDIEFRLPRSATLTGIAVDEGGNPVSDFEVRLEQRAFLVMDRPVVLERFQGREDGSFTVEGVPRDRFQAIVRADGFADWRESVDLSEGPIDLGEVALPSPAAIAGQVLGPSGEPIEGASVRVSKGGVVDAAAMSQLFGGRSVLTDEDGHFELEGLAGRRVRLLADKEGFAPFKSKPVTIEKGQTTSGVVLQLTSGGTVRGIIVDGNGTPLGNWNVQLAHSSGRSIASTKGAADGTFHLTGLAAGTHKIEAYPSDYMKKFGSEMGDFDEENFDLSKLMDSALKWAIRDQVVVREGEESEIELVFEQPDLDDAGMVDVDGSVTVGGVPLESGMVTLFRGGGAAPVRMQHVRDGIFRLERIRPGTYRIQVQQGLLSATIGKPQMIRVPDRSPHRIDMELPAGRIEGIAVYAEDGQPAAGIVLRLSDGTVANAGFDAAELGEGTLLTDAAGRFRFDGVAPGTYELFAKELMAAGSANSGRLSGLTVGPDEALTGLRLSMETGASLRVRVSDSRGPRPGAVVTLLGAGGKPADLFHRAITDADGVAVLQGLPEGDYRASVDAPRAGPAASEIVTVRSGGLHDVHVQVRRGCDVTVRATGEVTARSVHTPVSYSVWHQGSLLRAGQLVVPAQATTAPELRLGPYAPGSYDVRLESAGRSIDRNVQVPDEESWTLEIDLGSLLK